MRKWLFPLVAVFVLTLASCGQHTLADGGRLDTVVMRHATNLTLMRADHYAVATLANPWRAGQSLHTYVLLDSTLTAPPEDAPEGTVVHVPLRRAAVFTTAHASLAEMLHREHSVAAVADAQYMLLPFVQSGLRECRIADCGSSMAPAAERLVEANADAILLSPFEGAGYGALEKTGIPIIECADYMETSALGRAEWMRFYGLLFGAEQEADSLFAVVEKAYLAQKAQAAKARQTRSVLPERMVGSVWYVPGGRSSTGMLYRDAGGRYAYSGDTHSGSLSLPFETVLDTLGQADFWLLSYNGQLSRRTLAAEHHGYAALRAYVSDEVYGCKVDSVPYFEQVSWRPDWLLADLVKLFHPDLNDGKPLRYYRKLQ